MAAANAGAYAYARSEVLDDVGPPPNTHKQPSGADALAELRRMPPFLRHFLWRFVALVYRPPLKRGERAPTLSKAANDDAARAQRALALLPVMGIVLGAQPQSDLAALSTWHRRFAVMLLLTDGGVSEKLFNMIRCELNLTSARTARRSIEEASRALIGRNVLTDGLPEEFKPKPDEVPLICETVDNANVIKDGQGVCKLGLGSTLLGANLSAEEAALLKGLGARLLPKPNAATVEMMALTAADREVLATAARVQDMHALQFAVAQLREEERSARGAAQQRQPQPAAATSIKAGDVVTFPDPCRNDLTARVTAVDSASGIASVVVEHDSGYQEPSEQVLSKLKAVGQTRAPNTPTAAAPPTPPTAAADAAKRRKVHVDRDEDRVAMECEEGRELSCPCPTWNSNHLHSVDSKHHAAASQGWRAMREAVEEGRSGMPFLLCQVDNEFTATLQLRALLSDDDFATVVTPAYGHLLKALTSKVLSFHMALWSRRVLEATGLTYDTPRFNKLVNGSNIRKTNRHALMEDHALRVAAAKAFLRQNRHMITAFEAEPPQASLQTATCIDAFGRTKPLSFTAEMAAAADAFRKHLEEAVGADDIPPVECDTVESLATVAGFGSSSTLAQADVDAVNKFTSGLKSRRGLGGTSIPEVIRHVGIRTTGLQADDPKRFVLAAYLRAGLEKLSGDARVLSSDGKFADAAAHSAGLVAAAAALPHAKTQTAARSVPPIPDGANVNMKLLVDHLYFTMPTIFLLYISQRVRAVDTRAEIHERLTKRCDTCHAAGHTFCRCSSRHPWMVAAKACMVSVYMRPHAYQRTCVLDVMQNAALLQHDDVRVVELLLTAKELCYAVSVRGDTHVCESPSEQQEHEVVRLMKNTIRSQAWSNDASATARCRLASFLLVQEMIEQHASKDGKAGPQKAVALSQHDSEEAKLEKVLASTDIIFADIEKAGSSLLVAGNARTLLQRPAALFYGVAAATNKSRSASEAMRQGIADETSVSPPGWDSAVPKAVAVIQSQAEWRAGEKERKAQDRAREAEKLSEMMQSPDAKLHLPNSLAMLTGGKLGAGKAELGLLTLERCGPLGEDQDGRMPLYIFKRSTEQEQFMADSIDGTRGRFVQFVDGNQFLSTEPWMPAGSTRTLRNLARATIKMFCRKLRPFHCGTIVCLDVPKSVTWLRSLVHAERLKAQVRFRPLLSPLRSPFLTSLRPCLQAAGNIQAAQFVNMSADGCLDSSFVELMKSKRGFLPKFALQLMHELHNKGKGADDWDASKLIHAQQFVAFVTPHNSSVLMGTRSGVRYNGSRKIRAEDVMTCLEGVELQGQGEAMVYKLTLRWVAMLAKRYDEGVAAEAKLDVLCQDTDALCGYQNVAVHSLLQRFASVAARLPKMHLLLTVAAKDDRKLERLGLLAQQRRQGRCLGVATGDSLTVVVDALALYHALEADAEAPAGADGTRAIALAMLLAVSANDVKRGLHSIGMAKIVGAFYSERFRKFVEAQPGDLIAITPAVQPGSPDEVPVASIRLEYWAVAALLYAVFSELPPIVRQLSHVYDRTQLTDMTKRLSEGEDNYTVLRAACAISQREVQLPPPPALAAFISQALLAFEQWAGWLGQAEPRPATAAKEVRGYSYMVQPDQSVALEFSVLRTRPPWREGPAPTTGTAAFFREQFGRVYDAEALAPLLPAPKAVIQLAYERGLGGEPLVSVPSMLVVASGTALYAHDARALRDWSGRYSRFKESGVSLAQIVRRTIAQVREPLQDLPLLACWLRS